MSTYTAFHYYNSLLAQLYTVDKTSDGGENTDEDDPDKSEYTE
eukprot:CAMPEP_0116874922 /NCGR_PEP_ID=MMETSP0463-20121206/6558_1 /TAXON_ID=181622 /ORGANISM="Strombidinopsis sp, Strain SopsisLIS2011" /LENGTH=42 /DNA_ID= /DNA_START= /DNA_END= /DNA_ORIENTATION=